MRPVRRAGWVWAAVFYMEQVPSRDHEASPQSGLGGLQSVLQQKKAARAECTCAGAAHKHYLSLVLCCGGFLVPVSPA